MKTAVLVLSRAVSMIKSEWRLPSTRRSLPALDVAPIIRLAWERWKSTDLQPAIVDARIAGEPPGLESFVTSKAGTVVRAGVFILKFEGEKLDVRLSREACRTVLGLPERPSRRLATLSYWSPLRVILNGKADYWKGERYYQLNDYYVMLATESFPQSLQAICTIDLQADLA